MGPGSGVFNGGGGRWCDSPPSPRSDRKFFWLILHCFVGFISRLNRIKSVSRCMDICITAYYYTDVHARPEASSDMSVFTITAGWLLLANFNRRTVARRHKWYVHWRHRDRASRGRLMTLWPGSRTADSYGDLRDLRQIVNCKHW